MKKLAFDRTSHFVKPIDVEVLHAVGNLKMDTNTIIFRFYFPFPFGDIFKNHIEKCRGTKNLHDACVSAELANWYAAFAP